MQNSTTPGDRIRDVRKRRGLTQRELADKAGVSLSWVKKAEQGADGYESPRMEMLHKAARALRVPTSALAAGQDAEPPRQADVDRWEPVRRALEGRHQGVPDAEPTLNGLTAAFGGVVPLLIADRYDEVGVLLPGLLRDADALVGLGADGGQVPARRLRSQVRQVTALLMSHTWQFDVAADAAALAADDAGDELTRLGAVDQQCWGLIRAGHLPEVRVLADREAAQAEPRISKASPEALAAWGRLLIRLSTADARDNRPGEAADVLRYARAAAVACGADIRVAATPWDLFGPAAVAVIGCENAVMQERPEAALGAARRLRAESFAVPRYWYRHRLDVAKAHAMVREHGEAVAVLQEVRAASPGWLAQQRYARDILGSVIDRRRVLTPEMRDLADAVGLPL